MNEAYQNYLNENLLNEKKVRIKRKYGERPDKMGYSNTTVRGNVLEFVKSNNAVSEAELKEYMNQLDEIDGAKKPSPSWLSKNKRLFTVKEMKGKKFYTLSSYGERVYERTCKGEESVVEKKRLF